MNSTQVAPTEMGDRLAACEARLGYQFRDRTKLSAALTHASGADNRLASNERLEFLGDAILGTYVCEFLFHRYPEFLEGELTRIKSIVVSRSTCARLSKLLQLETFLILGKGMASSPSIPKSLLADVFEAVLAAIYLDGGPPAVDQFLRKHIEDEIEMATSGEVGGNFKSALQQYGQRELGVTPSYQLMDERGPDHNKSFHVAAMLGATQFTPAWGVNKKEAEQRAAQNALAEIEGESPPFADA